MTSVARALFLALGAALAAAGAILVARPLTSLSLVAAVAIGGLVLWAGLIVLWFGVRGSYDLQQSAEGGSLRRITVVAASVIALVLSYSLSGLSYVLHQHHRSSTSSELVIPKNVPRQPGRLIDSAEYTRGVPAGARAWRILYTTTRSDGVPAVASGLVVVGRAHQNRPHPVIAWAHGTSGINTSCAPSDSNDPVTFSGIPALGDALDQGWAIVATDYVGLGTPGPHPYLIGQAEGRSVLDSVRAAHELRALDLEDKTVAWGHSQGGHAALWAGILAPTYAPGIHLVGVAGIAPASDPLGLVVNLSRYPSGALFSSYVLDAYSTAYPDVSFDSYVVPAARAAMRASAKLCIFDIKEIVKVASTYDFARTFWARDPTTGPLAEHLRENAPSAAITVPVLIAQGVDDVVVLPALQNAYVAGRCAQPDRGPVDYRAYPGRDHSTIVQAAGADLLRWTGDRFAGTPAPSTC